MIQQSMKSDFKDYTNKDKYILKLRLLLNDIEKKILLYMELLRKLEEIRIYMHMYVKRVPNDVEKLKEFLC